MLISRCLRGVQHTIQSTRFISIVTMSTPRESPREVKKRSGHSSKRNTRRDAKHSRNEVMETGVRHMKTMQPKENCREWPSKEHKCILLYHIDSMSQSQVTEHLKTFGNIAKTRRIKLPINTMSTFEMSSSAEAENVWRQLNKNKPNGVNKIAPDVKNKTIENFAPYWKNEDLKKGVAEGSLLTGSLRINPRMFQHAFISDGKNPDILLDSVVARNRALPGDVVAVKLRPPSEWVPRTDFQAEADEISLSADSQTPALGGATHRGENKIKTGDVVGILEKRHNRLCIGPISETRHDKALFKPIEHSLPRLLVPVSQCPEEFVKRPKDFTHMLFVAHIESWAEDSMLPEGRLQKFIGNRGNVEAETTRILLEHDVEHDEFPPSTTASLPLSQWKIPREEYAMRRDMRSECIFTIDPTTARDLDDALHCRKLEDNLYEVGVHIADVSYFIRSNTEVDEIAAKRCTSVYLVQRVIPMLPPVLCEQLCSLNPGQDKLTYSVIWRITREGEILNTWYGRTVIRSCVKLSYDDAQCFIESQNGEDLDKNQFPTINDGHSLHTIKDKVLQMHRIAQNLRKQRYESGALRLDQVKLAYTLDSESGLPNSCFTYDYRESNELVEEFMLLANISVAQKLKSSLPKHAFLRCHPKPKEDMLKNVAAYCEKNGLKVDVSSSQSIATSLREVATGDAAPEHRLLCLQMLAIKPQELALYYCAGCVDSEEDCRHYALNIPLYTHFTSPIRRYADIIVHRQLSAALGDTEYTSLRGWSQQELQKQAQLCNVRKSEAKKVQDLSVQLFFYEFVKAVGSIEGEAVVTHVFDHSFDILPIKYGQVHRVYLDNLPIVGFKQARRGSALEITWPCDGTDRYKLSEKEKELAKMGQLEIPPYSKTILQTIKVFSTVNVVFEASTRDFKIKAYIRRQPDA